MRLPHLALALTLLASCADGDDDATDGRDDSFLADGKADAFGVTEGSPEACAVLRLVNQASYEELHTIFSTTALTRIELYRTGSDGSGTGPKTIDTLAELDAIPYVGPMVFGKLLAYALVHYPCGDAPDPVDPAVCMILRAANESSVDQLDVDAGLDRRAATAIVAAQPIASLAALDAVPYVGQAAIELLGEYATAEGLTCDAASCSGTGGTFDGVSFSRDEECRAVDFMNRARLSQMAGLGNTLRHFVHDCFPIPGGVDCRSGRNRVWTRIAQLDPQVGGTSMAQLKAAAAGWTDDGAPSDTIARTWQQRDAMLNLPVGFDKVFVVRRTNPTSTTKFCYELRDTPTATNRLSACVGWVNADSAPACSSASCLDSWVGKYVALRGVLKTDSFGYVVTVAATVLPHAPRD